MKKLIFAALAIGLFTMMGCSRNRLDVDVSDVPAKLDLVEFDRQLFALPADSVQGQVPYFAEHYPDFFELYAAKVLELGQPNSREFNLKLAQFYNYIVGNGIDAEVQKTFGDKAALREELTDAFRHYKYYFPEAKLPRVYTYISGFAQSVVVADGFIGLSLDKYLGENNDFYVRMNIERFMRRKMYKERVAVDCMLAIASTSYEKGSQQDNLLADMIYQGKLLYFVDAMLPNVPDSVKIGYSEHGIRWAEHNEKDAWDYLAAKKLLFSSDKLEIRKFTGEAPYTAPFTQNSPPQIGVWLGWQIVREYMKQNPDTSLPQLMRNTDYQAILRFSQYRP